MEIGRANGMNSRSKRIPLTFAGPADLVVRVERLREVVGRMSTDRVPQKPPGPLESWVPGIRIIRLYQPAWVAIGLRRRDRARGDPRAAGHGLCGLAGLPAVNGLYTTMACLVGYALFGPSRILVLGPDSSLGPLILLAILPLAITDDPTELVALAGMLALLVAAIEIGLGQKSASLPTCSRRRSRSAT